MSIEISQGTFEGQVPCPKELAEQLIKQFPAALSNDLSYYPDTKGGYLHSAGVYYPQLQTELPNLAATVAPEKLKAILGTCRQIGTIHEQRNVPLTSIRISPRSVCVLSDVKYYVWQMA
jgi:hypothetical protein